MQRAILFIALLLLHSVGSVVSSSDHPLILGIGNCLVDLVIPVPEDFITKIPGEKGGAQPIDEETFLQILSMAGVEPHKIPGGSCANMMKGFTALGYQAAFHGRVGEDDCGHLFINSLTQCGIEERVLSTPAIPTGQILILVTPDGERTFRPLLGANDYLTPEDLSTSTFLGVQHVHVEGYLLRNRCFVERTMHLAKSNGMTISFDFGCFELAQENKDLLPQLIRRYVDVVFCNEDEAFALTGEDPSKACQTMLEWAPTVIVTVGEKGCWVGNQGVVTNYPTQPAIALDSTGAGDLFASGFLYAYLQGYPIEECARLGNHLGGTVIQHYGAQIPPETWEQIKSDFFR